MCRLLLILISLAWVVHGQVDDDLSTLGDRISKLVATQTASLEGLGDRIHAKVQRNLRPVQDDLKKQLSELNGLGDRISQQVYKKLEPVRAIELNLKMKNGVGGVTIITHQPGGQRFIVKNNQIYICESEIDIKTGECYGDLNLFKLTSSSPMSDWCFVNSYSLVNNKLCLTTGGSSVSIINGQINCRSIDNSFAKLMPFEEYKNLCSKVRRSTEFRYIPNLSDDQHVEIPNQNHYVACENQQNNLCIFYENNGLLSTNSYGPVVYYQSIDSGAN